jgi:hypothetical protein
MRVSQVDTPVKSSRELAQWHVEWTYASGAPVYDKANSDQDVNIKTTAVVTETSASVITLKVPKFNKGRVSAFNCQAANPALVAQIYVASVAFTGSTGTVVVSMANLTPAAGVRPADGSRIQITLELS